MTRMARLPALMALRTDVVGRTIGATSALGVEGFGSTQRLGLRDTTLATAPLAELLSRA